MGLDPDRYLFERTRLHLPFYLAVLVPSEVHRALDELRIKASAAFVSFKTLEKYAAQCYFRLCPLDDPKRGPKHWHSMHMLFSFKLPYDAENPTLVPPARIPQSLLRFRVTEDAYHEYTVGFDVLKYDFLTGPYDAYLDARYRLHELLSACEMSEMDMGRWRKWMDNFLEEMRKWEDNIDDVSIPTVDEILNELIEMIVEKVDFTDIPPELYDPPRRISQENEYDAFSAGYAFQFHGDMAGEGEQDGEFGPLLAGNDGQMEVDPMLSSF